MNHFYQNLPGWADGIDLLYKHIINSIPYPGLIFNGTNFVPQEPKPLHFVEVGAWKGKSAAFMAVEIINSQLPIRFDVVDTWKGTLNEDVHQQDPDVVNDRLFEVFLENMKPVEGHYNPIRMTSVEAAGLYENASLDFVFIDGDHTYEGVKADLIAWKDKIRPGGIIAGHDFSPGNSVDQAVKEILPNYFPAPSGWCWFCKL